MAENCTRWHGEAATGRGNVLVVSISSPTTRDGRAMSATADFWLQMRRETEVLVA
ncbi:hypothetical protein IG631_01617 [Alternaria alternata]|jgi:hypothetical protein|nr:hypothetical protein IG631_01617 [Alternaria alternata]